MPAAKLIKLTALVLAIALVLCACSGDAQPSSEDARIVLPQPSEKPQEMILGNNSSDDALEITLHYPSENSMSLGTVTREITPDTDDDLVRAITEELMLSVSLGGSVEAKLLSTEFGSGVATVNLSLEAGVNRSEQDYLLLCASIASTLLEIDGVEAVNVLTGNRSDPLCGLPIGVFVDTSDNIAADYAQVQTEAERFLGDQSSSVSRNVLLYFPSDDGKYILPEVRELIFDSKDYAFSVMQALSSGPLMRNCSFSPIPAEMDLLSAAPRNLLTESGERVLELEFSPMLDSFLAFSGFEYWQLCGSIVLSLCSFVPELDAVRIFVGTNPINEITRGNQIYSFEDGLMRRADFTDTIGSSAMFCFANESDVLVQIETPLSRLESSVPLNLMRAFIEAEPADAALASVFPEEINSKDILGVSVQENTAAVNLSARFYAACQGLNAAQERRLIYAMVNTLAQLDGIGAVSFLVEGKQVDVLTREIYLRSPLIPDPGLFHVSNDHP